MDGVTLFSVLRFTSADCFSQLALVLACALAPGAAGVSGHNGNLPLESLLNDRFAGTKICHSQGMG